MKISDSRKYRRRAVAFVTAAATLTTIASARAQESSAARDGSAASAIGIGMEAVPYPYPVRFLPLTLEGRNGRMAYMDVPPASGTAASGKTVVLLHGKNFYGSYWADTIRALTAAGHRVIVSDQVGFGKSGKPDDIAYSFDLLAANTAALLDALKVEKAAAVGHSMGGMLAVRFARTYPDRTTHLVLENPIGLEDYRFFIPPATTEQLTQAELSQTDEAYRAFVRRYFVTWKPEYESFVTVRSGITRSGEFPRWARVSALTYQMIYQQPVRHEFGLIRTPTLLVIGQADRTAVGKDRAPKEVAPLLGNYPALGKAAARDIPNSRLVELPNVGHIPHLEAPGTFHNALLGFLK